MILLKSDQNQDCSLVKGLQFGDEPVIFDFETEEKLRVKLHKGYKNANKPGKILEFKRNK